MDIGSHNLRISGAKVELDKPLKVGTYDITLKVTGDIVKEEIMDNQDGTVTITYVLKAGEVEVI